MNVKYFQDTDTLYVEFHKGKISETRDLDENTLLDVDATGNIVAMTIEHARERLPFVEGVLAGLDKPDAEIAAAWAAEAQDRLAAYLRGELAAVGEDEVFGSER